MKLKKLIVSVIASTLLISSAISASAVEKVSTGTVYMGGYELYGSLTVYPIHAEGFAYCEKKEAGKSARTVYAYYNKSGDRETKAAGSSGYVYNNSTDLSVVTGNVNASVFSRYAGAVTYSKVIYPKQTYYSWTSDGTNNELRMGCYKR